MSKKIAKRDIKAALNTLADVHSYAEELQRTEGNRGANGFKTFSDTVRRASRSVALLMVANEPLPAWLISNWKHYQAIGWVPKSARCPEIA